MSAAGTTDPPSTLQQLLERLAAIEEQVSEYNRRSAHREAVIDRLHAENQELRSGQRRSILEPTVRDLIRLHDTLLREGVRLDGREDGGEGDSGTLIRSFASDVELILDRCGLEAFSTEPGQPYLSGEHSPLSVVPTDKPERDNTVAEVVSVGFRDRESGKVRHPLQARVYRYQGSAQSSVSSRSEPPATDRRTTKEESQT
ncbi:MAG: nucleotide exchange factor GrpE [Candidatus Dormibacteraeota bacterium]|nr:nucleotide exchange factor GrpE [Candidatus Dormibacteraeota bacterium]